MVVVGFWWLFWGNGDGSGGDSICIGDSYNSCRSNMISGEDGCRGGGGCVGVMVFIVMGEGKRKATKTTINTTTTTHTSNTTTKHSNKEKKIPNHTCHTYNRGGGD